MPSESHSHHKPNRLGEFVRHALLRIPLVRTAYFDAAIRGFVRDALTLESQDRVYEALSEFLARLVRFDRIAIRIADESSSLVTDVFVSGQQASSWDVDSQRPLAGTATETVMRQGSHILIPDCQDPAAEAEYSFLGLRSLDDQLPAMMIVPVFQGDSIVGSIMLRSHRRAAFSKRHAEIVSEAANLIAPILMQSVQVQSMEREVLEKTELADLGRRVGSAVDLESVWPVLLETTEKLIKFDRLVVAFMSDSGDFITDEFVHGVSIPGWDESPVRKLADVPASTVISEKEARIAEAEQTDTEHMDALGGRLSDLSGLKSAMYAPLVSGDRVIGTISVRSRQERAYSQSHLLVFERIAIQIAGPLHAINAQQALLRSASERAIRRELEIRNQQLSDINELKDQILTTVSHELRTPLTSILAFAGLIDNTKTSTISERDQRHLDAILRNGERLKALVNDLLDLYRMQAEKVRLLPEVLDAQTAIEQMAETLSPITDVKRQTIRVDASPGIQLVTDRQRLEQILTNLVSNSSKYSDEGSEILIAVGRVGNEIVIAVTDHGPGISDSDAERIFEAFERLDGYSTVSNPGTGLGLTIARRLAIALGGSLHVTASSASGTTFTLTIPERMAEAA